MDQQMHIYFISGLGADRKAFERLKLSDKYVLHYLDWIKPYRKESLDAYAQRLAASIDTSQPYALVGLSMGGMIATAMTQFLHPQKTILISSVGCAKEFPPLLKWAYYTKAYKLIPSFALRKANIIGYWMFGAKTKNERALMDYLASTSDPSFIKWAIGAIVNWKNKVRPLNIFHIHGDRDRILPISYTKPDAVIEKGSHFMVWTRAGKVSKILEQALG
ncbi:MAG TPA: alpha/beta hydrolase [Flavipsychrobacter sp.]|nr:alpha/beta hydrolase [Flavipsychrobacter sp.]